MTRQGIITIFFLLLLILWPVKSSSPRWPPELHLRCWRLQQICLRQKQSEVGHRWLAFEWTGLSMSRYTLDCLTTSEYETPEWPTCVASNNVQTKRCLGECMQWKKWHHYIAATYCPEPVTLETEEIKFSGASVRRLKYTLKYFDITRPMRACGQLGLDWVVGPIYNFRVFSTQKKHKKSPGTMKNHGKQWKTT